MSEQQRREAGCPAGEFADEFRIRDTSHDVNAADIASIRAAVTRYATAWLAGDRAAIAACYHDAFTLHYAGRNPLAGTHHGKAAALAALAEVARRANRKLLGIDDIMAGPRRGA